MNRVFVGPGSELDKPAIRLKRNPMKKVSDALGVIPFRAWSNKTLTKQQPALTKVVRRYQ